VQRDPVIIVSRAARNPKSMMVRDAVISFHCSAPNFVEINEAIKGQTIHSQRVQRNPDVVTKMESKYIFFANEADLAEKMVNRGHSCMVSVYFREP